MFAYVSKRGQQFHFQPARIKVKGLAHAALNFIRLDYIVDSTIVIYVAFCFEQNEIESVG